MNSRKRLWLMDISLALAFAVLAAGLRMQGYPQCPSDEAAWHHIVHAVMQDQGWPVSGPGYLLGVQSLSSLSGQPPAHSIPIWGVLSVFCVVLLLVRVYRQLLPARPWLVLASLTMSSYFWAPLLESRPQQWGQVLVLLGSWLCWRWLQGARADTITSQITPHALSWGFFLVLPLTAYVHILSHAVLTWMCVLLLLGQRLLAPEHMRWQRHASVWLSLLLSSLIYVLPQGPYALMLQDISQQHLAKFNGVLLAGLALSGMASLSMFCWRQHWHTLPVLRQGVQLARQHSTWCQGLLMAVVLLTLLGQAALLPPEAWRPYGGSPSRFVVFQLSNVALAMCFISGVLLLLRLSPMDVTGQQETQALPLPLWSGSGAQFLLITQMALLLLGTLSLVASIWLLHTNWLLRLLNYGLLFSAPITAVGLLYLSRQWSIWLRAAALFSCACLSLLAVLRPSPLLHC